MVLFSFYCGSLSANIISCAVIVAEKIKRLAFS